MIDHHKSYYPLKIYPEQDAVYAQQDTLMTGYFLFVNTEIEPIRIEKDSVSLEYGLFWYGQLIDTVTIWSEFKMDTVYPR